MTTQASAPPYHVPHGVPFVTGLVKQPAGVTP
ncbi:MAG: hypothetical protein JWM19_4352 [Actinomycetia bacterium]|nr:hypothetical protein [Actinomycetes bacterium]